MVIFFPISLRILPAGFYRVEPHLCGVVFDGEDDAVAESGVAHSLSHGQLLNGGGALASRASFVAISSRDKYLRMTRIKKPLLLYEQLGLKNFSVWLTSFNYNDII